MAMNPISVIHASLGIGPNGPVQKFFTDTCAKHMDKYVPMDTGALRETVVKDGEVTSNVTANTITYTQPYAHAQYVGYTKGPVDPKKYTTPGTGPYWDQKMISTEMPKVIQEVQDYIMKRG